MSDTLMISVSGVRGIVGKDLTPEYVSRFAAAFGTTVASNRGAIVVGRDSRTSGGMLSGAVTSGLQSVGCSVIQLGVVPTPTVQMAVEHHDAAGGIVISASHNPIEWNALKFIGSDGVFLDAATGREILDKVGSGEIERVAWDGIGAETVDREAVARHVDAILALEYVDVGAVRRRKPVVALDCVRGAGGTVFPSLLKHLGCQVRGINLETDGRFPRSPEPIPANLGELRDLVRAENADVGFAVDPDADRLAIVDEHGDPIGEDYTVSLGAMSVLRRRPGPVVVNLSTSRVIEDVASSFGQTVQRAPVGEANVARAMRDAAAVVGGEGNGGVMLPELHIGRDAPLAAALVLTLMSSESATISELVARFPRYVIVKDKAPRAGDLRGVYDSLNRSAGDADIDEQDGLRLAWEDRWLHVRPSGTEPIVRFIAEAPTAEGAGDLVTMARAAFESI